MARVVVLGQIARDIALGVAQLPPKGASVPVQDRREMLGGKGANQAVALAQLGLDVALVGVVGSDQAGAWVLERARADGIDVSAVARRRGGTTALILDVAEPGSWRYLEDVPAATQLCVRDVARAEPVMRSASAVLIQAQQPTPVLFAAGGVGRRHGAMVVLDGAVPAGERRLLGLVDVVRMDQREAELTSGTQVGSAREALNAARNLLVDGPWLAVVSAGADGNVAAWSEGHAVVPLGDVAARDTTGGGDAFVAALTAALLASAEPETATRIASSASGSTVERLGGRPHLTRRILEDPDGDRSGTPRPGGDFGGAGKVVD